jgi:hypothetical protein
MKSVFLVVAMAGLMLAPSAKASIITYDFNYQFANYHNAQHPGIETGPGGTLAGSLTLDTAQTGDSRVVSYLLDSFLKNGSGGIARTSDYDSSDSHNVFSFVGQVLQLISKNGATWDVLNLDFGTSVLGDDPIAVSASEKFLNCKPYGSFQINSCTLGNFGVGITGVAGANGDTVMSASLEGGTVSAVPLPATLPLLAGAFGLTALLRRRRTPKAAAA